MASAAANTQMGVMDTTGRLILPTKYSDLELLNGFSFFTATAPKGGRHLLDAQNRVCHTFPGSSQVRIRPLPDGYVLANNDVQTVYLSPTGELLRTFDYPLSGDKVPAELAGRFAIFLIGQRAVWGELPTGLLWRAGE